MLACLTIGIMGVLHSSHSAAPKHHLILRQRAGLVRKDVLHLAEILSDIKSSALQVRVCLLVVQIHVLMDEVHLADLYNLNRHKEGDGYQDLGEDRVFIRKEVQPVMGFLGLLCESFAVNTFYSSASPCTPSFPLGVLLLLLGGA